MTSIDLSTVLTSQIWTDTLERIALSPGITNSNSVIQEVILKNLKYNKHITLPFMYIAKIEGNWMGEGPYFGYFNDIQTAVDAIVDKSLEIGESGLGVSLIKVFLFGEELDMLPTQVDYEQAIDDLFIESQNDELTKVRYEQIRLNYDKRTFIIGEHYIAPQPLTRANILARYDFLDVEEDDKANLLTNYQHIYLVEFDTETKTYISKKAAIDALWRLDHFKPYLPKVVDYDSPGVVINKAIETGSVFEIDINQLYWPDTNEICDGDDEYKLVYEIKGKL